MPTLLLVLATASLAFSQPDPLKPGPYTVGVTTTVFVDSSRTDHFTKKPRTLVTEIWYPADGTGAPKNHYSDFFPGGVTPEIDQVLVKSYKKNAAEIDASFWQSSLRDARVARVDGVKFPLIVFSHGNGGSRHQNTFWCDYLASHGYIIAAPDHTGNARHTILDGQLILYQGSERANSAEDRLKDMVFVLDEMLRWNRGADSRFAGRIDPEMVAAAGMSFGSFTTVRVADIEPRFKALIAMSGAVDTNTNHTVPTLPMIGTEDRTIGERGNALVRSYYEKHQGPAFLFELKNGGHYSFTDIFKINRNFGDGAGTGKRRDTGEAFDFTSMEDTYLAINSYSAAFCGLYLKKDARYRGFLEKNHWPEFLIWKPKNF